MTRSLSKSLLSVPVSLALVITALGHGVPTRGRAHDFEESRRIVLSVEPDGVEILVDYALRPGRLFEALEARFDADHDGRATTPLERLARAQTVSPRIRAGWTLTVEGREVGMTLSNLAFPEAPLEGGRRPIHAVALYVAPLSRAPSADAPLSLELRTRRARGAITLEAQVAEGYVVTGTGLESRAGDPVLGPSALTTSGSVMVTVSRAAR
jgi:hypothetical protein